MATRHSGRKSSGGPGISREARHNLAAHNQKICTRRKPTAQNRKVAKCMRAKHLKNASTVKIRDAFKECARK